MKAAIKILLSDNPDLLDYFVSDWQSKWSGSDIYWELAKAFDRAEQASKKLNALGVAGVEELKDFGLVDNQFLGKRLFPKLFVGKILYHKGFPASTIIRHFADLYKDTIWLNSGSEKTPEQTT